MTKHRSGALPALVGAAGLMAAGWGSLSLAARRRSMSASMLLSRSVLGLGPKAIGSEETVGAQVKDRAHPQDAPLPRSLRVRCDVRETVIDGQTVVTLTPRTDRSNWHILYLHGGAYINALTTPHWWIVGALIRATGASVTVPLYALAPENDHRRGTALVDAVYDRLARSGKRIVVAGDSAGGNFAMNLAVRRRDAGLSLPDRLVLFSPWLDLAMRDERASELESDDVMLRVPGLRLCGRWWAGDLAPESPQLSPLHADLHGLPPVAVFQGDHDIFLFDARTFAQRCRTSDVDCRYHEYPGAFHVFMGATFTPEARDVFRKTAAFLDDGP